MDYQNYQAQKRKILESQFPYKVLEKGEIVNKGDSILNLGGMDVPIDSGVQLAIDRFMGVAPRQVKAVEESFGSKGSRDLRNFFALAGNVDNPQRIALIANPETRRIEGARTLRNEAITPEAFFDFAEMFMDRNGFYAESIRGGSNGIFGIDITLKPHHEEFGGFEPDDEFLKNGMYLHWNLGGIEAGSYIERLVCTNGATRTLPHKEGVIYELQPASVEKLLTIPDNKQLMNINWEKHLENAILARSTVASLAEIHTANKLLKTTGVESDVAEQIAPITMLLEMYAAAGIKMVPNQMKVYKSDINFWALYNRLTHFASHNEQWAESDNRRNMLMCESMDFLLRKRDITEYVSIFD